MRERYSGLFMVLAIGLVLVSLILATKLKTVSISQEISGLPNTISVSGQSYVTVEPDKAELYVAVVTEGSSALEVQQSNAELTNDVIDALKDKGVGKDDIETYRYDLYPRRSYEKPGPEIIGYELTHTLKVTTKKISDVGKLVDAAVLAGANRIERVVFGLTEETQQDAYSDALVLASGNAEEKAEVLADNLGIGVGKVISVSESGAVYRPFDVYPTLARAEIGAAEPTQISPQDIEVSAYISLVFEIQ